MVIAEFTLTLRGHAALGLQHLLCLVWSWLVSLVCVEVLEVRARVRPDLIEVADRMVPLWHSAHRRVCSMYLESPNQRGVMLYAPKSEYARGPPIMGMESRLEGRLKSFPLLLRLSRARLTSTRMSVKWQNGRERWIVQGHTFYLNVECSQFLMLKSRTRPCNVHEPVSVAGNVSDRSTRSRRRWRLLP